MIQPYCNVEDSITLIYKYVVFAALQNCIKVL